MFLSIQRQNELEDQKEWMEMKKFFAACAVTLAVVTGIGLMAPAKSEASYTVYESGYNYDTVTEYDDCGNVVYTETVIYSTFPPRK